MLFYPSRLRHRFIKLVRTFILSFLVLGGTTSVLAEDLSAIWDLYAGESTISGYRDGPAELALFAAPRGIHVDRNGNVLVADTGNGVIRRISPSGEVTTVAGKAKEFGLVDGSATTARFVRPVDLTVAPNGNIYVFDNARVRQITPAGQVTTVAGGGTQSFYNDNESAPALSVAFWTYETLTSDADNNIYVPTIQGVVKISPAGVAMPLSGFNGGSLITDLSFDASGNLYVVKATDGSILKRSPDGTTVEIGPRFSLSYPERYINSLAVLAGGQIWVSQEYAGAVSRLPVATTVPEPIAQFNLLEGAPVSFRSPSHVTAAPQGGVYLSDRSSHSIQHVAPDGTVTVVAGQGAKTGFDGARHEAAFVQPTGISAPGGDVVYIMDNWRIRKMDLAANTVQVVAKYEDAPYALKTGQSWQRFVADSSGNFYFANFPLGCISRLSAAGEWSILAGTQDERGVQDGTGAAARFNSIFDITMDGSGNLYVSDSDTGYVVRRVTPAGVVTTIAGSSTEWRGDVDGKGADAGFGLIYSLAATPDGAVWVGESASLRYISAEGIVSTVAGNPEIQYPNGPDGQGPAVVFNGIRDITAVGENTAFLLEFSGGRIRRATRDGFVDSIPQTGAYVEPVDYQGFGALATDAKGRFYVVDQTNRRVLTGLLTDDAGRLANLSVLKRVGDGGSKLTVGFVTAGDTPKPTLVRAVGPSLANYGITSGFMADPMIQLFDRSGTLVETGNDWNSEDDNLISTSARLGAFPLNVASTDASLAPVVPTGPFTATVSGADGQAGSVLVEVYDAELTGATRLTNLSTLTEVTPGGGLLIAGFVITGDGEKTVLIRGVGPSLTQFGFTSNQVLRDPRIRLFKGSQLLDQNDNWAGAPLLTSAFNAVGAFALLDTETTDAALLLKLNAGSYSVHLESVDDAAGQAIIEVYEVK